jgi:cell division septation protein DedD
MNNVFSRQNIPEQPSPGRGVAIAIVVFFTSLSFTLGYFVGKSGTAKTSGSLAQLSPLTEQAGVRDPESQSGSPFLTDSSRTGQTGEPENQTDPLQRASSVIISEGRKTETPKGTQPRVSGEAEDISLRQALKENNPKQAPVKTPAAMESGSDGTVYTVQIAAFKSSEEAEAFRKRFEKKGVKTFITTAMNKNNEKIYKIKTGEFKDRKKAEILSLKLNKTEHLKTFVTLKKA